MTIQTNFPAAKPSLLLDFAGTKQLDPRITFVRTTTATYYDSVTTAKAEENLLVRSQNFSEIWVLERVTVTADSVAAPDGTTTADTITNTTDTGAHVVYQSSSTSGYSIVSGLPYTISVFAKKNTNNFLQITVYSASNTLGTGRANFDLQNGSAGTVDGGTSTITSAGNGWYRCSYTVTASASGTVTIYFGLITSSTAARFESYTGLGTESVYLWGAQVEQRSAVTAYTAARLTTYIPVLQTAAAGVARFDHNPVTRESLGLLVQEARTNLWTYSADFSNAAWTKVRSSIDSNIIVAPDGTLTGDKLIASTDNNTHFVRQDVAVTSGIAYTQTVFAKAGQYDQIQMNADSDNGAFTLGSVIFSLSSGSVVSTIGTISSSSITAVGNGWYRCQITASAIASVTGIFRIYISTASNATFTGDGYSGIYIWGAQLEAGAFATSYIPTVASTVTRNADSATMSGTNFTSWYNDGEGTIYGEFSRNTSPAASQFPQVVNIDNGTTLNTRLSLFTNSGRVLHAQMAISAVFNSINTGQSWSLDVPARFALTYQAFNHAAAASGFAAVTRVDTGLPKGLTTLRIGDQATGGGNLNGTIRKLAYYPLRLTNAQLQALTS